MTENLPGELTSFLNGRKLEDLAAVVVYRNFEGRVAECKIIPLKVYFGHNEWHSEDQYLLRCGTWKKRTLGNMPLGV